MSPISWHQHFADTEQEDFLADYSLLVNKSSMPIAYAVIHEDDSHTDQEKNDIWISQIGVHPNSRRKGSGTALLIKTIGQLSDAGYQSVKLSVNINNPGAIKLYEKNRF